MFKIEKFEKRNQLKKFLNLKKKDEEFVGKQKEIIDKTPTKRNASEMTVNAERNASWTFKGILRAVQEAPRF